MEAMSRGTGGGEVDEQPAGEYLTFTLGSEE